MIQGDIKFDKIKTDKYNILTKMDLKLFKIKMAMSKGSINTVILFKRIRMDKFIGIIKKVFRYLFLKLES